MTTSSASPRECAELLLSTIPHLTRIIAGCCRQQIPHGEDAVRMGQTHLLHVLARRPCSLRELAARHHVTPSTMSRSVDVLVQRGWIARQPDPHDRRQVILSLTETGRGVLVVLGESMRESLAQLVGQLDPAERSRLYDGLQALSAVLTRIEEVAHADHSHCGLSSEAKWQRSSGAPSPTSN